MDVSSKEYDEVSVGLQTFRFCTAKFKKHCTVSATMLLAQLCSNAVSTGMQTSKVDLSGLVSDSLATSVEQRASYVATQSKENIWNLKL